MGTRLRGRRRWGCSDGRPLAQRASLGRQPPFGAGAAASRGAALAESDVAARLSDELYARFNACIDAAL